MPAVRKLPDDKTLRRLYQSGATTSSIAEQYGVHPSAVSFHWSRLGLHARRGRHALLLPWTVPNMWTHKIEPHYLRLLSRAAAGETVKDRRVVSAWNWAKRLEDEGLAIHFDTAHGWYTQPVADADQRVKITTDRGEVTLALGSIPEEG